MVGEAQLHGCIVVDTVMGFNDSTKTKKNKKQKRTDAFVESSSLESPLCRPTRQRSDPNSIVCIRLIQAPRYVDQLGRIT